MSDPIKSWIDANEVQRLAQILSRPNTSRADMVGPESEETFEGFEAHGAGQPVMVAQIALDPQAPVQQISAPSQPAALPSQESQPPAAILQSLQVAASVAEQHGLSQEVTQTPVPHQQPTATPVETEPARVDLPTVPPSFSETSSTHSSSGPFLSRVKHFIDWLREGIGAGGAFLCDREGALVYDDLEQPRYVSMARSCAMASYNASQHAIDFYGSQHIKAGPDATLAVLSTDSRYGLMILGAITPTTLEPAIAEHVTKALRDAVNGE